MIKKILFMGALFIGYVYASTGAAFLDNGMAARGDSLGGACTALADDLDAFYYNPAGYGFQKSMRVNTMGARAFNLSNVYYAGYGLPLGFGYLATSLYSNTVSDISETTYVNGSIVDSGESFSYGAQAYFLSYGFTLDKVVGDHDPDMANISFGATLKKIQEHLYKNSAQGVGLDLGLLYRLENIRLGMSVLNVNAPTMTWDTESKAKDKIEMQQRLGLAWDIFPALTAAGDIIVKKNNAYTAVGLEYRLLNSLAFRAGAATGQYTMGLGLFMQQLNMDYVYILPIDRLIESTHKVSVGYIFNASEAKPAAPKSVEKKEQPVALPDPIVVKPVAPTVAATVVTESIKESVKEPAAVELKSEIVLLKKSVSAVEKKVKAFYKLGVTGAPVTVKTTISIVYKEKEIDRRSAEHILVAEDETLSLVASLGAGLPGNYVVTTYIKMGDTLITEKDTVVVK